MKSGTSKLWGETSIWSFNNGRWNRERKCEVNKAQHWLAVMGRQFPGVNFVVSDERPQS